MFSTQVTLRGQTQDLVLKNPVIAASGTFGFGLEYARFGDLATLGGISVKGLSLKPRPGNPMPRIMETPAGMLNAIGLQNPGVDYFLKRIIPNLPWQDTAIIANIYGSTIEEYAELGAVLDEAPEVAAIEINVSCPNVHAGGALFGASATMCGAVTAAVRQRAPHKHLMVKLSPNVTDIAEIARSAEDSGADSLSCINTLLGMGVNLVTRRPALANIVGGLSGPAIKPVALRCVWQVSRAVKIPVIGIGGIVSTTDILEFLLVGASAIQAGTASFMRPDALFALVRGFPDALAAQGVSSPAELVGALVTD